MEDNTEKHYRRSIRLKEYDYSQAGGYFITICTHNWKNIFGKVVNGEMILNKYGKIVNEFWREIPIHFQNVEIDWFVVMPNHVRGIMIISDRSEVGAIHELPLQNIKNARRKMLLPKVIGYYKMNSTKQINIIKNTPGIPIWQRNYYEHIIRNEEKLYKIRQYIQNNPLKWHLDRENLERVGADKFEEEIFRSKIAYKVNK